jgi:hypothetical protein
MRQTNRRQWRTKHTTAEKLTSSGGRELAKPDQLSLALCNLGAVDIRRATTRLAAWVVVRVVAANSDMVVVITIVTRNEIVLFLFVMMMWLVVVASSDDPSSQQAARIKHA